MSNDGEREAPTGRGLRLWLVAVGLAAVVVGIVLLVAGGISTSFGWAGYGAVSDLTFTPEGTLLTAQGQAGLTIGTIGLVLLAFAAGWAFGVRRVGPKRG